MPRPMSKDELALLLAFSPNKVTLGRDVGTYIDHVLAAGVQVCTGVAIEEENVKQLYWVYPSPGTRGEYASVLASDLSGPYKIGTGFCDKCQRKWAKAVEVVKCAQMPRSKRKEPKDD